MSGEAEVARGRDARPCAQPQRPTGRSMQSSWFRDDAGGGPLRSGIADHASRARSRGL